MEINELPLRQWKGEIHVVRSEKRLNWALGRIGGEKILGFDTETRPVFKKGQLPGPPTLLQLATSTEVFLFQLKLLNLDNGLADLLSRRSVIKSGVSVRDDILGLKKIHKFKAGGFVDLGQVSMELKMQTHGLRNLAANLLGFRISKSAQCSNWAKDQLSPKQVAYAATDAWVSRELHLAFVRLGVLPSQS
ncbi:MAG: 3'-5' exonuclease domain-containing protein 2 [Proteobacteria bacterium]|nr:3'-5' exonuclease domain-containing protein 2 [Pseudomonadota bacterium]